MLVLEQSDNVFEQSDNQTGNLFCSKASPSSPPHLPPPSTSIGEDSECVAAVKDTSPVLAQSLPFTFDGLTELALLSWG